MNKIMEVLLRKSNEEITPKFSQTTSDRLFKKLVLSSKGPTNLEEKFNFDNEVMYVFPNGRMVGSVKGKRFKLDIILDFMPIYLTSKFPTQPFIKNTELLRIYNVILIRDNMYMYYKDMELSKEQKMAIKEFKKKGFDYEQI